MNTPTIIVAEDHPMFRAALVLTLKRLMPEAVLMEAASHDELEQALARCGDVKLVLLDLRMPGSHGLSSLVFLRGEYPEVSVAIISGGAYAETIGRARQLGASAFIPKSASIDTIAQALSCVIRGERWFPEHDEDAGASGRSSHVDREFDFAFAAVAGRGSDAAYHRQRSLWRPIDDAWPVCSRLLGWGGCAWWSCPFAAFASRSVSFCVAEPRGCCSGERARFDRTFDF